MNDLTRYLAVRGQMKPGDVMAFAGSGLISGLIGAFSGSNLSHVAMVRQSVHPADGPRGAEVQITEATLERAVNGVRTTSMASKLGEYDGAAWWLPLSDEVRKQIRWEQFYAFIGASDGIVRYDTPGLFEFLARSIPIIGPRIGQSEHAQQMFCSGYDVAIFEAAGVLRGINWNKTSPQDLAEMKLYGGCVQLIGAPASIARFNTI